MNSFKLLRKKSLVKRYIDKNGRKRVAGVQTALRASAAYPVAFGYAVAVCLA